MADQEHVPPPLVHPEPESIATNTEVTEMIARLQRQVEEQQQVIA